MALQIFQSSLQMLETVIFEKSLWHISMFNVSLILHFQKTFQNLEHFVFIYDSVFLIKNAFCTPIVKTYDIVKYTADWH